VEQGLPFSFPQKLKSFRLRGLFITGLERAYLDESRGGCIGEEACFAVANSNVTDFSNSTSSLPIPRTRIHPAALFPRSRGRDVDWPSAGATVSPNRSWHYLSPLPLYHFPLLLCDWPTGARSSPVFSVASELFLPPCGPVILNYIITFYRMTQSHSLILVMSSIFSPGLWPQFYYNGTISVVVILLMSDSC
jgi:hypothetical protein